MSVDKESKESDDFDIEAKGGNGKDEALSRSRRRSYRDAFRGQGRFSSERSIAALATPITKFKQYWTRLAQEDDSDDLQEGINLSLPRAFSMCCASHLRKMGGTFRIAFSDLKISLITVVTFIVLCTTGLSVVLTFANNYHASQQNKAVEMAKEMGYRIPREINRALVPLFTMEEILRQIDVFDNLPFEMNETKKYLTGNAPGRAWRNATDLCLDPNYTTPFAKIARSIKNSSKMEKILVNLQLAPLGAVCLAFPLVNTEDFEEGIVMNNTGAIGLDILNDPVSGYYTLQAIKNGRVTIQGPLKLVQGGVPVVEEALIARNPVSIEGYHNLTIEGENYPFWGFTTVLLNWAQLKRQLQLHEFYSERKMDFYMTRTDKIMDFESYKVSPVFGYSQILLTCVI